MRVRLAAALALLWSAPLEGQSPTGAPGRGLQFSGEVGTESELYRISGRERRRPPESARLFFSPTLRFRSITVTGNFLVSTDQETTVGLGLPGRQRINQLGFTPTWSWGKVYLGSFADTYTPLTWTGVRVDGAGFDLSPGRWRLGLFTGSSRQPVFGGATSGSFGRSLLGARVGYGKRPEFGIGGRFIDLVFLRVRDDPSSLPPLADSTPIPYLPDSLVADPDTALLPRVPINPYAVTPQENAVLSTAGGLSFLDGALAWRGEIAGSIHSRDRRASLVSDDVLGGYPGIFRSLVTPRAGTHVDYAYQSHLDVRIARLPFPTGSRGSLSASLGLQSVGAGYVSLGTAYLPSDLRGFDFRTAARFRTWSLQVDGLRQRDNLNGQKLGTTHRSRLGVALTVQPLRSWHASVRAMTVGMTRDVADSLGATDYAARTLSLSQSWIPGGAGRIRSLTASYTWQDVGDDNPLRANASLRSHTADARVTLALGRTASLSPAVGVIRSRVGAAASTTRATYGLSADWREPTRRWVASGSISRSQVSRTSALTTRLNLRFPITALDYLSFVVRTSRYRSLVEPGLDFDEQVMSLRWSRRL